MSRYYMRGLTGTLTAANANYDLIQINPGDDKPVRLRGFAVSNYSETGDAAEEVLQISILRMTATVTDSNGTSAAPHPLDSTNTATGATVLLIGATVATTSGTTLTLAEFAWNIRGSPWLEIWPSEFAPQARQSEALLVRMNTTVADDISIAVTVWLEEE